MYSALSPAHLGNIIWHMHRLSAPFTRKGLVQRNNKRKRGDNGQAKSADSDGGWPMDSAHKFCRFVLYKENMDSSHALGCIARLLHIQQSSLSVAGTKDKRAVTVQHVTAFKVLPGASCADCCALHASSTQKPCVVQELGLVTPNSFSIQQQHQSITSNVINRCRVSQIGCNT